MTSPLPTEELELIASSACEKALGSSTLYMHDSASEWNTIIINTILQSLIEKTSTGEDKQPAYKYIANSTIIQHQGKLEDIPRVGRRGMHSAVGAFWNTERDGTFSYKWTGAEQKGMDVVISINWIAV